MKTNEPAMPVLMQAGKRGRPRNFVGMVLLILSGVLVILVAAASWAPDSRMTELRWLPGWVARWADRDPNIRTAAPFIPMVLLLASGFGALRRNKSSFDRPLALAVAMSVVLLLLSELGQVFLPMRTADVIDLLWGGVGIAAGTVLAWGWEILGIRQDRLTIDE